MYIIYRLEVNLLFTFQITAQSKSAKISLLPVKAV